MIPAWITQARVPRIALAIVLLPAFGNHGLWAGQMVLNVTRGVTLGPHWPAILRAAGEKG